MVQGTRDAMGNKDEVDGYPLDSGIQWLWLDDGNHDLKPRKASGHTHEAHMANAASSVAAFVEQCLAG
jgi:predicted alpha/beta-hydrolase family hydrolase